jgi:hypothetical protein
VDERRCGIGDGDCGVERGCGGVKKEKETEAGSTGKRHI